MAAEPSGEDQLHLSDREVARTDSSVVVSSGSPAKSDSGDPLLDAVPIDCLGLAVAYERLPRARSNTDDDEGDARSDYGRPERRSPKVQNFLGRLFDSKPKKQSGDGRQKSAVERVVKKVDCGVQTDEDSDGSGGGRKEEKKKKKRSSWLPDPEKRWPVQGFY